MGTGAVAAAVVLTWAGGIFFGMRYEIAGQRLAARTGDVSLQQHITQAAQAYRLTVVGPDNAISRFSLHDMGLQANAVATATTLRVQQHAWANRLHWWRPIPADITLSENTAVLDTFIATHISTTTLAAHDATLQIVSGTVHVSNATSGKQYGLAHPAAAITAAAARLQAAPLRLHTVTLLPAITSDALASTKSRLEHILQQHITISADGETVAPSAADIAGWLTLAPDDHAKTVTISINNAAVQDYVNALAAAHTHPPRAAVVLASGGGIPGQPGASATGIQATADALAKTLLDGTGQHITLAVNHTSYQTIHASGAGKWIEVDLTNKRLYTYSGDTLVRSFLVSAGAARTPSPTGTFAIYSKFSTQTMSGANADGSHYVQPNVPWINYFYRDYAIHGNYWRPASYFGNVNSSHGCVGLRTGDALWVYNWAPIGTQVVLHR